MSKGKNGMGQKQAVGSYPFNGNAGSHWLDAAMKLGPSYERDESQPILRDLLWVKPLILHGRQLITVWWFILWELIEHIHMGYSYTSFWSFSGWWGLNYPDISWMLIFCHHCSVLQSLQCLNAKPRNSLDSPAQRCGEYQKAQCTFLLRNRSSWEWFLPGASFSRKGTQSGQYRGWLHNTWSSGPDSASSGHWPSHDAMQISCRWNMSHWLTQKQGWPPVSSPHWRLLLTSATMRHVCISYGTALRDTVANIPLLKSHVPLTSHRKGTSFICTVQDAFKAIS